MKHSRIDLESDSDIKSLCWCGDSLVDVAGGLVLFSLDGSVQKSSVRFAFPFDAAIMAPSGRYAVIYQRLGTKGAIVDIAKVGAGSRWIVREIDRSFYLATAYEYPVAFIRDADGKELLAHCPKEYNRLEFEEIESGKCLTAREGESADFFHSRLQTSPKGRYLLSAGWIWHPIDWIGLYDISQALREPRSLDKLHEGTRWYGEIASATFADETHLLLSADEEINPPEPDDEGVRWGVEPEHVALFDLESDERISHVKFPRPLGEMMVVGGTVVGFYEHPRAYDIRTGELVAEWPDIATGKQNSSIIHNADRPIPHIARDAAKGRFAVASEKRIVIVSIEGQGDTG